MQVRPLQGNALELSIVIPVKDEAESIVLLLRELRVAMSATASWEVLVVDDGSSDDTAACVQALAASGYPQLRLLRHARSCGQSAALSTGAAAARGAWLGMLDGDGQNDPADLARIWAQSQAMEKPPALWIGHRVERHDDSLRRISSRIANFVRAQLLHDGVPDTGCGTKLMRREVFMSLPYFDHMHRFLPALVRREGYAVQSVPVRHRPRLNGRSKYGVNNRLWAGLVDLLGVMWLMRRRRLPQPAGAGRDTAPESHTQPMTAFGGPAK
jgi:dolichol-phosphate mannosyltransferase